MVFYAYILENPQGGFYIGHTEDLEVRVVDHNRTDEIHGKYTRKNGPWVLVWSKTFDSRARAMAEEKRIKAMKSARWIRENLLGEAV